MRLFICFVLAIVVSSCASTSDPAPRVPVAALPDMRPPKLTKRVEPIYPAALREQGVVGVVVIAGIVPKEGGPLRDAHVVRSDDARLDPWALEAVKSWIFIGGLQDGQPVDVEFQTTVRFSLK
jgi:periplasmic protein TonB